MRVHVHTNCQAPNMAALLAEMRPDWENSYFEVQIRPIVDRLADYYRAVETADMISLSRERTTIGTPRDAVGFRSRQVERNQDQLSLSAFLRRPRRAGLESASFSRWSGARSRWGSDATHARHQSSNAANVSACRQSDYVASRQQGSGKHKWRRSPRYLAYSCTATIRRFWRKFAPPSWASSFDGPARTDGWGVCERDSYAVTIRDMLALGTDKLREAMEHTDWAVSFLRRYDEARVKRSLLKISQAVS
jgi:hypothetical protein